MDKRAIRRATIASVSVFAIASSLVATPAVAPAFAQEAATSTQNGTANTLPINVVDEHNWDEEQKKADDYWPLNQDLGLSPKQRITRVTTSDPIDIYNIDYEGFFIDANGRTNLRLVYEEKSAAVSAVWHNLIFKFDKDLFDKIDFEKSYGTDEQDGSNKQLFTDSSQANEKYLNVRDLISLRTVKKTNVPINLVLKEGVTFESLGKENLFIQMRLTDKKYERIYAFAPKKTSIDYTTYTRSTVIPVGNKIDTYFRRGNKPSDELIVSQRSFMSEFIANPSQYSDSSNIGILRTSYQWAHKSLAKANSYDPVSDDSTDRAFGFLQAFDASLLEKLKEDSQGNVAFTNLLEDDRDEVKSAASYPYVKVAIKRDQINVTPDGKIAYIIIAEPNFKGHNNEKIVTLNQMDGTIYKGTDNFTGIDFNVDKTKFAEELESIGENQVRYPVLTGWAETNPNGTLVYEKKYESDLTIFENESFFVDTVTPPTGNGIAFQVGDPDTAFIRREVGNYAGNASVSNFNGIDVIGDEGTGLYSLPLREGATVKAGDAMRIYMPNTADHVDQLFFVEVKNATRRDKGGATLELESNRNVKIHLGYKKERKAELFFTQKGQTEETKVTFGKSGLLWGNDSPKVGRDSIIGTTNASNLSSGGDFWIKTEYLEPGKDIYIKMWGDDGTEYVSSITYVPIDKLGHENPLVFTDNSAALSSVTVEKSPLVPYQEIFTNDYAAGTDEIYKDPHATAASEDAFMTNATTLEGYTRYDGGKIRMRYIPPTGDVLIGKTDAVANEFNNDGDITKEGFTNFDLDGTDYEVYPYSIDLTKLTDLEDNVNVNDNLLTVDSHTGLVKDMRLLVNTSTGSTLPSDWMNTRVRTRVMFNSTLGDLQAADGTGVKIVPDNEKWYGEDGYTANGFANGVAGTGDAFAQDPTAPAGKTFLGWVTKAGVDTLKNGPMVRAMALPSGYTDADFITTADKFNALPKDQVFTDTTPVTSHQVVYAVYTEEKILTFDANGGAFADDTTQVKDGLADGVNEPAAPTLDGKQFVGWAATPDATEADPDILTNVTESKTVYAVWKDAPKDTTAPAAPEVKAGTDGSATVTPPTDTDTKTVTVSYTDEAGKPVSVVATKGDDGKWTLPADAPAGVTIDPATGVITVAQDAILDGSTITATAEDASNNKSVPADGTVGKDAPAAPSVKAGTDGSATVTPPTDADTKTVTVSYTDEAGKPVTVVATKGDDGKWSLPADAPSGVTVDPATGVITVAPDAILDESELKATAKDATGNESDPATGKVGKDAEPSDTTAPSAPVVATNDKGGAVVRPPADPDTKSVTVSYTDENDKPVTVTATKGEDGTWTLPADAPSGVTVDPATGGIRLAPTAVKDDSTITATADDAAGNTSSEAEGTVGKNVDETAPAAPVVATNDKGGAVVRPPADPDTKSVTVKYTDENDKPVEVTATKGDDGTWSLPADAPSGVTVDPATGDIRLAPTAVKDDSTITATADDAAGNTSPVAEGTVGKNVDETAPAAPKVSANEIGGARVTPPADEDTKTVTVAWIDEAGNPVELTATKGDDGKWTLPADAPTGVTIDPETGVITFAPDAVKDGSTITATADDAAGNTSPAAEDTVTADKDMTPPLPPTVNPDDKGNVVVRPPADEDTKTVTATYTDEAGTPVTVVATKGADGTWTLPADAPAGVTVDATTGDIFIPADAVKDGSEVTATATDASNNTSDEATGTAGKDAEVAPDAPLVAAGPLGGASVTPPEGAVEMTVKFTDENNKPVELTATKGADGTWTLPTDAPEGVTIDPTTGRIIIQPDSVLDESEVSATAKKTKDGAPGPVGKDTTKVDANETDTTAPHAPVVVPGNLGGVVVNPPEDPDTTSMTVTYTDEDGKPVEVTATKGADGTWTLDKTPEGVSVDPATGAVRLEPDAVKDQSEVVATAKDATGNESQEGTGTTKDDADKTAPAAPVVGAGDKGGAAVRPPADPDTTTVTVSYVDENDQPVTLTATKGDDGQWTLDKTPEGVSIDPESGVITFQPDALKDESPITATAKDATGNESDEASATTTKDEDTTPPAAPVVGAGDKGGAAVRPPVDAETLIVNYTDENDQPVTLTATKDKDGKWVLDKTPEGVSIDPESGVISFQPDAVKDESKVTATAKDAAGNESDPASATTTKDADTTAPQAPAVAADDLGGVTVTPPADADTKTVTVSYTDEAGNPVSVVATKGDDGTWTLPADAPAGVSIDPATGVVTIAPDAIKDGSEVTAVAADAAGNDSVPAKDTAGKDAPEADETAPASPIIATNSLGGVTVTPPADEDTTTVTVSYTDEAGNPVTVVATKGDDGTWTLPADAPAGVSIDPSTGVISIDPDAIKDGSEVTAVAADAAGNESQPAKATAPEDADTTAPAAPSAEGNNLGGVTVTPPADADTATVAISYTDEAGNPVSVVATKGDDGTWTLPSDAPAGVSIDPATGVVTIAPEAVKDGSEVTAKATDKAGNTSAEDKATAGANADLTPPSAPVVAVDDLGGARVTPPVDAEKVTVTFTDESGKDVTVVATRGEDGKWTLPQDAPEGVSVDPATGVIAIAPDAVQDGSDVVAVAEDAAGNESPEGVGTVGDDAEAPEPGMPTVGADNVGGVVVTPPAGADEVTVDFTDESGNPVTVVATRGEDGTWTIDGAPEGVTIDPATGVITIAPDAVKDGSEVTAIATTDGADSAPATNTAGEDADTTAPAAPVVAIGDKGSATVISPADPDTATLIVNFIDEAGNDVTVIATRGEDGTWTLNEGAPSGVTVDAATGAITIAADAVKDETDVVAIALDKAENESPEGKGTTKANADTIAPTAPVVVADDLGGITVNPPADADKVTVTFTDESGKDVTVTATRGEDGKWTLPQDAPEGVTIDPATGVITIAPDAVKDGSEVVAVAADAAGNESLEGKGTAQADRDVTAPEAAKVDAQADGSVIVTPPADDVKNMEITFIDPSGKEVVITATLGKDGWAFDGAVPAGITIDPATGKVVIPGSAVKGGTKVNVVVKDAAGNAAASDTTTKTAATADVAAKVVPVAGGAVTISPAGADVTSVTVTFVTEDGKTKTVTARKAADGTWTAQGLGEGITLDAATGQITLDEKVVKDGSTVKAVAADNDGHTADASATAGKSTAVAEDVLKRCFASEFAIWNPIYWLIPAGILMAVPLPEGVQTQLNGIAGQINNQVNQIAGDLGLKNLLPRYELPFQLPDLGIRISPEQSRQLFGAAMVIAGLAATGFYFSACSGAVEVTSSGATGENSSVDVNQDRVDELSSK